MNRRRFLCGAGASAALAGCGFSLDEGLWNPCLALLPPHLAAHELVRAAWEGLDPRKIWDAHAHLVGTGDSGGGVSVSPRSESLLSPGEYARRIFFLNAGCAHRAPGNTDRAYVEHMRELLGGMRPGVKLLLFAFERTYREDGTADQERTSLHVPDAYARDVAGAYPQHFEWVASIHPYRGDCVDALAKARTEGARAVKWLPAAMGIDPQSPRCDPFYAALARARLPLVSHAGLARAVIGADMQDFGNPLRLRRALDAGVRVVVPHCASMGRDRDLDKGESGPYVESFSLFSRMMEEKRFEKSLYGDISAMPQINRAAPALARVLERTEWHARLLNGSDYPLPGVMPIFSVDYLASLGLLEPGAAPVLKEIRGYNPLLFDFVLKRHLRSGGKSFAKSVFETRSIFDSAA